MHPAHHVQVGKPVDHNEYSDAECADCQQEKNLAVGFETHSDVQIGSQKAWERLYLKMEVETDHGSIRKGREKRNHASWLIDQSNNGLDRQS